jgi:hypothetical protein
VHIKRTPRVRFKGKSQQAVRVCFPGFAIQARTIAPPALPAPSLSPARRRPPHEPAASSAPCLSRRESQRWACMMKLHPHRATTYMCAASHLHQHHRVWGAAGRTRLSGRRAVKGRWNCGFPLHLNPLSTISARLGASTHLAHSRRSQCRQLRHPLHNA